MAEDLENYTNCRIRKQPRWHACRIKATTPEAAQEAFEAQIRRQHGRPGRAKKIPRRGLTIAIGLHRIPRYDRRPDGNLSRQKRKTGLRTLSGTSLPSA